MVKKTEKTPKGTSLAARVQMLNDLILKQESLASEYEKRIQHGK